MAGRAGAESPAPLAAEAPAVLTLVRPAASPPPPPRPAGPISSSIGTLSLSTGMPGLGPSRLSLVARLAFKPVVLSPRARSASRRSSRRCCISASRTRS
eukprot:2882330-Lingulodinium_polyedra.AAC.1